MARPGSPPSLLRVDPALVWGATVWLWRQQEGPPSALLLSWQEPTCRCALHPTGTAIS